MPGAALAAGLAAVVIVGADRLLALAAARQVARKIALATTVASRPVVRIGGIFLPQLAAGTYRTVDVTMSAFTAGGVDFAGLTARLSQVRAPLMALAAGGLTAGNVTATATIAFSALRSRLPAGLTLEPDGDQIAVRGSVLRMPVSGVLRLSASGQAISVTPRVLGLPSLLGFVIALPAMPPGLSIGSVRVSDVGLLVSAQGGNVTLARRPPSSRR